MTALLTWLEAAFAVPEQSSSHPETAAQRLTLRRTAALVWAAGAKALVLRAAWQSARLACKEQDFDGTVFYTAETIAAPFVLGALRPRVYLPVRLSAADRRAVLAHEQAHLRRGDHLLRPVFYLATCLHWELRIDGKKIPPQEVFPDQVA